MGNNKDSLRKPLKDKALPLLSEKLKKKNEYLKTNGPPAI